MYPSLNDACCAPSGMYNTGSQDFSPLVFGFTGTKCFTSARSFENYHMNGYRQMI